MPNYKLTYFAIRGLAEPSRWIFAYKGIEFEDVRIPLGGLTPEMKQELNLPWGQVPLLEIDGKQRLGQSRSIMMYLAKKFSLVGKDDWEEAQVNEVVDTFLMDYFRKWIGAFQDPTLTAEQKQALINSLVEKDTPEFLIKLEKRLDETGTGFFVGNSITVADIYVICFLNHFGLCFNKDLIKGFSKMEALLEKVTQSPGIKEWIIKRPQTSM